MNGPSRKLAGEWKTYDNSSGLLAGVICLLQDSNGLLWLGTYGGGLSCYDGVQFTNYTTQDGLVQNHVRSIHQDRAGRLWCKTWGGGISCYDGERFTQYEAPFQSVNAVSQDAEGLLWFCATDGRIYQYDGTTFLLHARHDPLYDRVCVIHRDAHDRLWLGTQDGIACYDGRQWRLLTTQDGLVNNNVRVICEDARGRLWFGTGAGVSCYDGGQLTNYTTQDGLAHDEVWALYYDRDDRLWVGTFGGGVTCYDGAGFVVYTPQDGLLEESVDAILQDTEGSFWFAHATTGLSRFEPEFFQPLCADPVPHGGFTQDPEGRLWYGSYYQLGCIEGGAVARRRLSAQVTSVLADHRGGLWVASWGDGVYHFPDRTAVQSETPEHFTTEQGLTDPHTLALMEDDEGRIWVGAQNGDVYRSDGRSFRHVVRHPCAAGTLLQDRNGLVWVGGWWDGGLSCYDGTRLRTYTVQDGLPANAIRWLLESRDGKLWVCTLGGGVACYDGQRFESYSFEEGMWNAMMACVCEDAHGHLWFGSEGGGVHRYDGKNFQVLTRKDGLLSSTVTGIAQRPDGTIVFATKRGIVCYPPVSSPPPPVFLRQVIADRAYGRVSRVELTTSAADRVTFQFRGISFKTNQMRYNYKLEGYDQDWRATWDEEATYEHLPAGEYRFQVIALNRDLIYSADPAVASVIVQPDPRDVRITALQTEIEHLRREVGRKYEFENIVGHSTVLQQVYALMEKAIDSGLTVLISGETGTGKELVAKAIHYHSSRKHKPLLELNCGAVPKDLIAATLFGSRKGAFTGAYEDSTGLFEAAAGGTVLLDEIGEMGKEAQVHLLRVLQEQKVQRLGETRLRDVDARIIAITNRDLEAEVQAGRFREDLYYRLNVFPIQLPALRDRPEDLPMLAGHFLSTACQAFAKRVEGFAPGVFELLQRYAWPGNVRELENEVYRAAALVEEGQTIQPYHFSSHVTQDASLIQDMLSKREGYTEAVNRFRRHFIEAVLRECGGNRSEAAKRLGMHRPNLVALMKKLGVTDE